MATKLDSNTLLVNLTEAASLLSVGRTTVYKLAATGDLKIVKLGCSTRVTMESIRALVSKQSSASLASAN